MRVSTGDDDGRTVENHGALVLPERVGRDAAVLAEVGVVDVADAEAERERVLSLVVRLDPVLHRARDAASVLLPVVDGVRKRRDGALEDRLATSLLADATIRHRDLRSDCSNTIAMHFLKRFALCYSTVICLSVLSVCDVGVL